MQRIRNIARGWLPLAVAVTLLCGLVYITAQQLGRRAADDPQIQMAEDAAAALAAGQPVDSVLPSARIELSQSTAPYLIVFDQTGQPLAGSALLNGRLPVLPAGIFDYVLRHGQDRVTWQPAPGVRSATVVVGYGGAQPGFVMAGRSLRETERRADDLLLLVVAGWLVTLAATLVAVTAVELVLHA